MAGFGKRPFYSGGYSKSVGTTEMKWGSYLGDLMIDTAHWAASLWKDLALYGKTSPEAFTNFIQTFFELYNTTREFMENSRIKSADTLFWDTDLRFNKEFDMSKVKNALRIYKGYNRTIYHTKALLEIIQEANVIVDRGK